MYVTDLVVADTVNTMPEKTLEAFADHGEVQGDQVTGKAAEAAGRSSTASADVGIDFDDVLAVLEKEGVEKFEKSWHELRRHHPGPARQGPIVSQERLTRRGGGHRLEHRRRRRVSSCSSATATRRPSPPRSSSWWPTGSPAGWAPRTPRCGAPAAEEEAAKRLAWVDLSRTSRPLVDDDRRAARASCTAPG